LTRWREPSAVFGALTARVVSAGAIVRIGPAALRRAVAEHADLADVLLEAFRVRRDVIRGAAGGALQILGRPDTAETLGLRTYVTQSAAAVMTPWSVASSRDSSRTKNGLPAVRAWIRWATPEPGSWPVSPRTSSATSSGTSGTSRIRR
jgi:hypothetical protein